MPAAPCDHAVCRGQGQITPPPSWTDPPRLLARSPERCQGQRNRGRDANDDQGERKELLKAIGLVQPQDQRGVCLPTVDGRQGAGSWGVAARRKRDEHSLHPKMSHHCDLVDWVSLL